MNVNNVMIVLRSGEGIARTIFNSENVSNCNYYKKNNFISRQINRIYALFNKVNKKAVSDEVKNIKEDTIIIFDSLMTNSILNHIVKLYPDKRIILFYWNPVDTTINPKKVNNKIEIWTYSKSDAIRYNLKYNTTFHSAVLFENLNAEHIEGIYFIGKDKKRKKKLDYLEDKFKKMKYKTNFHITKNCRFDIFSSKKKPIDYKEVINQSSKYMFILDYYNDDKAGMSLRPLEALIMKKNIITNNTSILEEKINQTGIFHKVDSIKFTFKTIDEDERLEIIEYYSVKSWLRRFNI